MEFVFLIDASSRDLGVASTKLRIALFTWDESSIFGNGVVSEWNRDLIMNIEINNGVFNSGFFMHLTSEMSRSLKMNSYLFAHILIMGSVHMVITPGPSAAIEIVVEPIFVYRRRSPLPFCFGEQRLSFRKRLSVSNGYLLTNLV